MWWRKHLTALSCLLVIVDGSKDLLPLWARAENASFADVMAEERATRTAVSNKPTERTYIWEASLSQKKKSLTSSACHPNGKTDCLARAGCYGSFGCFSVARPFTSSIRPINNFPEAPEIILPAYCLYTRHNRSRCQVVRRRRWHFFLFQFPIDSGFGLCL